MKHEARSTKFEINSKDKKFQIGSGVLNFDVWNFGIVSDFGFRISNFQKRKDRGFTLLETVVALAILTSAIVGPMSLVSSGIIDLRASKNRIIASYLAEEGMEIVRGIKENNALAGRTANAGACNDAAEWDYGLCPGAWRANISTFALESGAGNPLLFDPGSPGLYNYQSGNQTIFTRQVDIVSLVSPADDEIDSVSGFTIPAGDILDVMVTVSWSEKFGTKETILHERFYNWQ